MKQGKVRFHLCPGDDSDFLIESPNSLFKWSQVSLVTRQKNCSHVYLDSDQSSEIVETLDFYQQIRTWALENQLMFQTNDHIASIRNFVCVGRQEGVLVARLKGNRVLEISEPLLNDFCIALIKEGQKQQAEHQKRHEKKVA